MSSCPGNISYCLGAHCACQSLEGQKEYHGTLEAYDRHQELCKGSVATVFYHPEYATVLGAIQPPILTFEPYPYQAIKDLNIILPSQCDNFFSDEKFHQSESSASEEFLTFSSESDHSSSGTVVPVKEEGTSNGMLTSRSGKCGQPKYPIDEFPLGRGTPPQGTIVYPPLVKVKGPLLDYHGVQMFFEKSGGAGSIPSLNKR
ncbi:uncharacterized protein MELLADRAFT_64674 [Melampsora larici-populina 98AG31]|uniref:Uncharacterized protein n=1 Tax=Melampsora larici-populina (strain 98AG31 / pathotype 3-4-7) TaxID=747676 RepID=F4RSC4_MELLP|nr:uncharacterized protein MELLADRAFT_64674 [Melampsora larici-populina 98AG31]EGG04715.1 hypothetical protein MELLADRAFT_64674 [Melampsora larici-populina 98AG31]